MLTDKHLSILEKRGITAETASRLGWESVTDARDGKDWIKIPFFRDDRVVNWKYRTIGGPKEFRQEKGGEQCLYNLPALTGIDREQRIVVVEGECFRDAEVLTPDGWIDISVWDGQPVMQAHDDGTASFSYPLAVVQKRINEDLVQHSVKGWFSETTARHNMVSINGSGFYKHTAEEGPRSSAHHIPRVVKFSGSGIPLSDAELRLAIAISADATIDDRKSGARYVRFGLKKVRKIFRLRGILHEVGILASDNPIFSGYQSLCFSIPAWVPGKLLPWDWLLQATARQRQIILDELVHWDGNHVPNRTMKEFSTNILANAQWVQTLAHTSGFCSSITSRKNKFGEWFKVSLLRGKNTSSWQSVKTKRIPYSGMVYCLTMPSGMLLVRQNGKIGITGNCDAAIAMQCGYTVVSVPNGAPMKPIESETTSKYDYLSDIPDGNPVILAVDGDEQGTILREDIAKRIGRARCLWVNYPKGCKDLNDAFMRYGEKGVSETIRRAEWFQLDGVYLASELVSPPTYHAHDCGIDGLSDLYKVRLGDMTVLTGPPGDGKTTLANEIACNMAKSHGWKTCFASFEQNPKPDHIRYLRNYYLQKPMNLIPDNSPKIVEADVWIDQNFVFTVPDLDSEESADLDWCLSRAARAIAKYDCKLIIIDPWNEIDHSGRPAGMSLTEYAGYALKRMKKFARKYQIHLILVAHPAKPTRNRDGEYPMPSLYDIADSAHFFNKPDIGIILFRGPEGLNTIKVQKCRYVGLIGKPGEITVKYDSYRGIFQYMTPDEVEEHKEKFKSSVKKPQAKTRKKKVMGMEFDDDII